MVFKKKRKLLSFVDTKMEAIGRQKQFKRSGAIDVIIRPQFGAFGVFGKTKKGFKLKGR